MSERQADLGSVMDQKGVPRYGKYVIFKSGRVVMFGESNNHINIAKPYMEAGEDVESAGNYQLRRDGLQHLTEDGSDTLGIKESRPEDIDILTNFLLS